MSSFRNRLDALSFARHVNDLHSDIAIRHYEHAMYSEELSKVKFVAQDLRTKLEELESVAKDLENILTDTEQTRDTVIADLRL